MKKLQILIAVLGFMFFSVQHTHAQKENKVKEKVYKTTISKSPQKVKDALKNYSGYRISEQTTFTKKNNITIYKVQVTRRNWSHFLLISETGKIIGIDDGENSVVSN
jgi:hypothetical protein